MRILRFDVARIICLLAVFAHASSGFNPSGLVELLLWLACLIFSFCEIKDTSGRKKWAR
jgi:fucose 4-O-acetylase-like acetyltransferase